MQMNEKTRKTITVFHCTSAFGGDVSRLVPGAGAGLKSIPLPCSSMVKEVYLLKAFEAGADAVVVLACPEGECRYVDGNIRARKRIERVKGMLDEIGLGGERLTLVNAPSGNEDAAKQLLIKAMSDVVKTKQSTVADKWS